jgi:hypothetical protein
MGSGGVDPSILGVDSGWRCGQLHARATLPPGLVPPVLIGYEPLLLGNVNDGNNLFLFAMSYIS